MALLARLLPIFIIGFLVMPLVRRLLRKKATGASEDRQGPWGRRSSPGSATGQATHSPYEVLGVKPGAPEAEITAAYHRLVQMYHPDKVANMAPEFKELAESRMKEINAAYQELKRGNWR